MDQRVSLPDLVKKLVSKSSPLGGAGHKSWEVDDINRYEPFTVDAFRVPRVILDSKLFMNALCSKVGYSMVWLDGCKWIVCYRNQRESCGAEERAFSRVGLSYNPDLHTGPRIMTLEKCR